MSFVRIAVENLLMSTFSSQQRCSTPAARHRPVNATDPQPSTRGSAATLQRRSSPTDADSTTSCQTGCYRWPPPPKKFFQGLHDEKYSTHGGYEIPRSRSTRDCHPHGRGIFLRRATHRGSTCPRSCKC